MSYLRSHFTTALVRASTCTGCETASSAALKPQEASRETLCASGRIRKTGLNDASVSLRSILSSGLSQTARATVRHCVQYQ